MIVRTTCNVSGPMSFNLDWQVRGTWTATSFNRLHIETSVLCFNLDWQVGGEPFGLSLEFIYKTYPQNYARSQITQV